MQRLYMELPLSRQGEDDADVDEGDGVDVDADGNDGTHSWHQYTYNPSHTSHLRQCQAFLLHNLSRGFLFSFQPHLSFLLLSSLSLPVERVELRASQDLKSHRHKMVL